MPTNVFGLHPPRPSTPDLGKLCLMTYLLLTAQVGPEEAAEIFWELTDDYVAERGGDLAAFKDSTRRGRLARHPLPAMGASYSS